MTGKPGPVGKITELPPGVTIQMTATPERLSDDDLKSSMEYIDGACPHLAPLIQGHIDALTAEVAELKAALNDANGSTGFERAMDRLEVGQ